jgi:hypothetical protein
MGRKGQVGLGIRPKRLGEWPVQGKLRNAERRWLPGREFNWPSLVLYIDLNRYLENASPILKISKCSDWKYLILGCRCRLLPLPLRVNEPVEKQRRKA